MRLFYYYLVFEEASVDCPGKLWETILQYLDVKFAVYGYWQDKGDKHDMHVIAEDNKKLTLYRRIPRRFRRKIIKKIGVKNPVTFMKHMLPVLLDQDDLCIKDELDICPRDHARMLMRLA